MNYQVTFTCLIYTLNVKNQKPSTVPHCEGWGYLCCLPERLTQMQQHRFPTGSDRSVVHMVLGLAEFFHSKKVADPVFRGFLQHFK